MKDATTTSLERTLSLIQSVPDSLPVALLLRHSARDDIMDGGTGLDLPLNELGVRMCHELGRALTGRLRSAWSSPVLRCVQTAELLCQAADLNKAVNLDRRLGAPGVYVLDEEIAWNNWLANGNHGVIKHLVSGVGALPGMADPTEAANALVKHMLDNSGCERGVHLFVSHDSIVAPTVARVFDADMRTSRWPDYLDAAAFWPSEEGYEVLYRGMAASVGKSA
ncbi:histidine phosphatase family protein [Aquabacterium sp.]|uniref:histidine phosphatase family protein n=1 Tax=Aquabacterium sp. TaxID=1872578 RepID=UPI0035B03907